jgi:hypothetical protein
MCAQPERFVREFCRAVIPAVFRPSGHSLSRHTSRTPTSARDRESRHRAPLGWLMPDHPAGCSPVSLLWPAAKQKSLSHHRLCPTFAGVRQRSLCWRASNSQHSSHLAGLCETARVLMGCPMIPHRLVAQHSSAFGAKTDT